MPMLAWVVDVPGAVVYSNYDPAIPIYGNSGHGSVAPEWSILSFGASENVGVDVATPFQVTAGSYRLDSISLPLAHIQEGYNLGIFIFPDDGGHPGSNALDSVTPDFSGLTSHPRTLTYPSSLHPILASGNIYWLTLGVLETNVLDSSSNAVFEWPENNLSVIGAFGYHFFDFATSTWKPWQTFEGVLAPAFQIEGTLVPEPASVWLLFVGLSGLGFRNWRKP